MNTLAVDNSLPEMRALDLGRESARKQAWGAAFERLSEADRQAALEPEDLQLLSMAAQLIGKEAESGEFLARAHQGFLGRGQRREAARCACWLSFVFQLRGDRAQASGWLSRARRLLESEPDCVEHGYVLLPVGMLSVREGNYAAGHAAFLEAATIGRRFGDVDLASLALQGQGRSLIRQGEIPQGQALLDEAMVAVVAGEVSPMAAGGIYCSVIEACGEIFDFRRAQEWTSALERWCNAHADIVPYRGHCLIRRAEILQMQGAWQDALVQAQCACERLSQPTPKAAVGPAFYRKAEMHRLRGEFAEAEHAYREASQWERSPRPGLALLRLAQGETHSAYGLIRQVVEEAAEPARRAEILAAYVEIALAAGELKAARASANELLEIAGRINADFLHAIAGRAHAAVLMAEEKTSPAIAALRQSLASFRQLEAPYEVARTGVLLAWARQKQGNADAAKLEATRAREIFQKLGAAPDVVVAETLLNPATAQTGGPLTDRELQVLKLIASGATNRSIAGKLKISEKTVARHVSNIFNKLDLPSRAAATAYVYQKGLV
jgi:DNA-binding NarL/FixJ family response regulator